jgi:leader peptidase (prepilin peptidase)/N-methyltransferase
MFDAHAWAQVPFGFWSLVFFVLGAIVGSFLNVCVHRMPLEQSIVSPQSHCPHCQYSIPWYLNIPLVTWVYLRGKCANCRAPISVRYFLVELLTAVLFLESWLTAGHRSPWLALIYCIFLSGLIVATFIDFEHFIIPDEITLGGIVAGFLCSLLLPALQGEGTVLAGMKASLLGMAAGGGIVYAILRLGKLFFGRQRRMLPAGCTVLFTEDSIILPGEEIRYEDVLYRRSDTIELEATRAELSDRCYRDVLVRLSASQLKIGEDVMDPEDIPYLEVTTDRLILPREAMGLGDVKFMAAIGAFLGWQAVLFSLFLSSIIGTIVSLVLILLGQKSLQSRIPYGPYIALAALVWLLGGSHWWQHWCQLLWNGR